VEFEDRVVIVTGASSGIGRVTARSFAARGAVVIAVARREELLERLIAECREDSPHSHYLAGDLGRREFAERVVEETVERHGRVDVLVNNAAISKHKQIYHIGADEAERVMDVNFRSCLWTTFAAIPPMLRAGGGFIVNVSSFAAEVVPPRESVYAASKAAMSAFTEGLWNDLEGSGIHAALVIPGAPVTLDRLFHDALGEFTPPEIVTQAIFDAIRKRRREITVPRRKPDLMLARFLRAYFPGLLRFGMRRMDPVPQSVIERARARAVRGLRLGDLDED